MNKKIFPILILSMFLFTCVSAESIGTFKVNTEVQLINFCSTADCTYANLTQIIYPNGTIQNFNDEMTKEGNTFNYSYTPTELGEYYFITCSNPSGTTNCDKDSFRVTKTGISMIAEEVQYNSSGIYFLAILGIVLIGLGFLFYSRNGTWIVWVGISLMILGFIVLYYDLSLTTMYMETTSISGNSVTGVFILFARMIKLLPYITALIIAVVFVKRFREIVKVKKQSDGWDENRY